MWQHQLHDFENHSTAWKTEWRGVKADASRAGRRPEGRTRPVEVEVLQVDRLAKVKTKRTSKQKTRRVDCSSVDKESACHAGDPGSIPGSGRSSGEGNGNPLQYSCLENLLDRGAWQPTVHRVARVGHDLVTETETTKRSGGIKGNSWASNLLNWANGGSIH